MGYRVEPDGSDAEPMMMCRCERPHAYYDHEEEVEACMKCGHILATDVIDHHDLAHTTA